jgi:hypothetical protein
VQLHQSFTSLDDAQRILSRLRHWQVLDKGAVKADQSYLAAVRMRLDLTQMPEDLSGQCARQPGLEPLFRVGALGCLPQPNPPPLLLPEYRP